VQPDDDPSPYIVSFGGAESAEAYAHAGECNRTAGIGAERGTFSMCDMKGRMLSRWYRLLKTYWRMR